MSYGKVSGSGKYSYQETYFGRESVFVAHMPEDGFKVRIVFRTNGETHLPVIHVSDTQAELLWASLQRMASDLNWGDKLEEKAPQ